MIALHERISVIRGQEFVSLTVVRSVVTVSRFRPLFNKATKSKINTAAPIIQTQGCVYHTLTSSFMCTMVFVLEMELLCSCAHKATEGHEAKRRKQNRNRNPCKVFMFFCFNGLSKMRITCVCSWQCLYFRNSENYRL